MARRRFTGAEVAAVLIDMRYYPVDRAGSHLKLRYEHPKTGEVRNVTPVDFDGLHFLYQRFRQEVRSHE